MDELGAGQSKTEGQPRADGAGDDDLEMEGYPQKDVGRPVKYPDGVQRMPTATARTISIALAIPINSSLSSTRTRWIPWRTM